MPASIFQGDSVKLLKDKLKFKTGSQIITGDSDDPTSVAKDAPQGSLYLRSSTNVWYNKQDSGSSTNWSQVIDADLTQTLNNKQVFLQADATLPLEATTKQQLDAAIDGVQRKASVKVSTTANITLSGEQTIDGVLTSANRVLVKSQSTQSENGIYVSAAGAWSRATDANSSAELNHAIVSVESGTADGNKAYEQTTDNPNIGVDNIIWNQTYGAGTYVADETSLTLAGAIFSIKDDGVTTAKILDANVTVDKLATDSVSTAKILNDNITTAKILNSNVTEAKLATDSVSTVKIINANVTVDKLATDSVSTIKIINANVTEAKLATDSVSTAKIINANVTEAKLATDSVSTAKIINANVTDAKIATGVDAAKLADGSVSNTEFQYINSLSSNAQTQLDSKLEIADIFSTVSSSGVFTATANKTHLVDTSGGTATVTLPAVAADIFVRIKDKGNSNTNNITVNTPIAETIDGAASDIIDSDYGSIVYVCDGTNWWKC